MLYAGLDLSRKRLDFHLLDAEGATVDVGASPPDADGLRGLSERLDRHGQPIRAAIESMNGARFVHDRLELAGWQVEIADAQKVKGLAPLACKTDRIDAWVLAELAGSDRFRTAISRACTAAGVPAFSPHDLRHRRVSLLHLGGMPWARIGEIVGCDDLVTTARTYTHVVADERELRLLPAAGGFGLRPRAIHQLRLCRGCLASQSLRERDRRHHHQPVNNIFTGINADLAVSDSDAWIYRLGYNITLLGRIVFIAKVVE
jgi:hypothetical protein